MEEPPPATDLEFPLDGGEDEFELTFDGLDDLYFPAENETFLIPDSAAAQEQFGDFALESEGSGISGDRGPGDEEMGMNCSLSSSSGCSDKDSPRDSGAPVSSQGSGNCGSGVSEAMNAPSSPESGTLVVEQKVKVEEGDTTHITKRKKETDAEESRTSKFRRSVDGAVSASAVTIEEDEKKKTARLMRNRESAQLSRQRKKHYVEELEEKARSMHSTIADLKCKISYFVAENATLRQQLGTGTGAGTCPPPPPGMYPPMAPMHYPWMPYMVKPQGSQVPLIPIPRLNRQQPASAPKGKKSESKKSESKTKKVASISVLGLLFCLFLFGALAPIVNINYGGIGGALYGKEYRSDYITDRFHDQNRRRVLDVDGHHVVPERNGSEPLVASLFVPRNDKLVKIDGNLIIHSILASEKAMATQKDSETNNERKTDLAIPNDISLALPVLDVARTGDMSDHLYRTNIEKQRALSSGSADDRKDHLKSTAANGKMQQWFREGLAGPMLSSGMCTEVFQFDVSSTSGAIIPASPASNATSEHHNTTNTNRGKNRRILQGLPLPVPLPGSDSHLPKDHSRNSSCKDKVGETKPASSMIVSVLVDPREGGDGGIEGMMGPKSLSRVFVVVLLDSVKYVTYSCVLPLLPGGPHLVTT